MAAQGGIIRGLAGVFRGLVLVSTLFNVACGVNPEAIIAPARPLHSPHHPVPKCHGFRGQAVAVAPNSTIPCDEILPIGTRSIAPELRPVEPDQAGKSTLLRLRERSI
jgi:hypothetical protein